MPKDFAVAGTAQDKMYGVAEGLWEPDLVSHIGDDSTQPSANA